MYIPDKDPMIVKWVIIHYFAVFIFLTSLHIDILLAFGIYFWEYIFVWIWIDIWAAKINKDKNNDQQN